MNVSVILLIVLTIIRLWIALQLFLTARKSHLNNLYWLAGLFALAVYSLFTPTSDSSLSNYTLFHLGFIAGHFCLAMFIHTTFYRNRKSPIYIVLGLLMLAFIVDIYAFSANNFNLIALMATAGLVNWIWHFFVARSAYTKIAHDPSVENWVKSRYQLMLAYIVMMLLATVQVAVSTSTFSSSLPRIFLPIGVLIIIVSIILQFLVWVMPEPFRLWLNRTQQARLAHEDQQPRSILDVFGAAMTADTGLNTIACLYAIRSTVAKKIGSQDSNKIQQYINTMTYYEWDALLQQAELQRILLNGGADKNVAIKAINNAQQALIEKQSLFTLSSMH
jgi:hypothetical protein